MLRLLLCSTAVLGLMVGGLVADEAKKEKEKGKKHNEATITKIDAKKGEVEVRMKNKEGKEVEKTFKLEGDIVYLDSTGRVATVDFFRSGDDVLVLEESGHLKEMKKQAKKPEEKKPASKK
jgi:hypothetical protein